MIDYKFWYIRRDDAGIILDCAIRFYEGEMKNIEVLDKTGKITIENRYVRIRRLDDKDLESFAGTMREESGQPVRLYNQSHFGQIKTNEELCGFLNKELTKHPTLEAVEAQKIK